MVYCLIIMFQETKANCERVLNLLQVCYKLKMLFFPQNSSVYKYLPISAIKKRRGLTKSVSSREKKKKESCKRLDLDFYCFALFTIHNNAKRTEK